MSLARLLRDAILMCEGRKTNGSVKQTLLQSAAPRPEGERADERVAAGLSRRLALCVSAGVPMGGFASYDQFPEAKRLASNGPTSPVKH